MIKLQGYFTGFSSKADGSAGLRFSTQELTPDDFAELKKELNNFGHILFNGNEIDVTDIPVEQAEDTQKTPSKRIRAVLFIEWKQKGEKGDFESYYRQRMDYIINRLKSQLDQ